ncbi:MAG: histidine kinase [Steroidobacter sp.]
MPEISTAEEIVSYLDKGPTGIKVSSHKPAVRDSHFNNDPGEYPQGTHLMSQILVVAFWATCFGIVLGTMDFLHTGNWASATTHLVDVWLWALLVPFVLAVDRRLPFSDRQLPLRIIAHLAISVPVVAIHVALEAAIEYPFQDITWSPFRLPGNTYYYFMGGVITYFTVSGAIIAYRYYSRYQTSQLRLLQVEKRFLEAHLHNLRMQLEPHFVANALNAISSEVDANPSRARQLIENIGTLLRLSHEYKDKQLIPLVEELAVLDHYLAIQKVRFGERLNVRIKIAQNARYAMVPSFLLQPLAENAVRHGLEPSLSKGIITISARRIDGYVRIRVADNGAGLPPDWPLHETTSGQGLTITRERLAAIYHDEKVRLTVSPRRYGGTVVQVLIPDRGAG